GRPCHHDARAPGGLSLVGPVQLPPDRRTFPRNGRRVATHDGYDPRVLPLVRRPLGVGGADQFRTDRRIYPMGEIRERKLLDSQMADSASSGGIAPAQTER